MKTPIKKSSSHLSKTAINVSAFLVVCFFAVVGQAQSINGPLKPRKPVRTPTVVAQPTNRTPRTPAGTGRTPRTNPGTVRTNPGTRVRTQPGRTAPVAAPQPVVVPQPVVAPQPVPTPSIAAPQPVSAPSVQTPEQVMERFMNFQQSESVTVKDWESVINQTQSDSIDTQTKAQLFIARGYVAFSRADYSSALIQFKAAAFEMSDSALPHYSIGQVYLVTKQPNQAENSFEKSIKLNKNFALAYKGMGDALTALKKNKKAQDYYDDAARIAASESTSGSVQNSGTGESGDTPADPTTLTTNSIYNLELNGARELTKRKKWQVSLDKLLPLAKSNPTADLYIAIGDNYFGMEQWLSAQQTYEKATVLNPNSAVAFYKSGLVLFETNEFQSAADAFEKSLILDQTGLTINRERVRKMANEASEKAKDMRGKDKKKRFFVM